MVTLKIKNWLQKGRDYKEIDPSGVFAKINESDNSLVKPYDTEKWKDGRIYEFDTLREVVEFINSCDIEFTEEAEADFTNWTWSELDLDHYIDPSEDNLIIFSISMHEEWRD